MSILENQRKFKEISNKWDEQGAGKDGDDKTDKNSAEKIERARDFIDENEVDTEDDDGRKSGKLGSRKAI